MALPFLFIPSGDDDKKKQDMDMTFFLSFATLNIERANNCYK
jgi:hypothetical protein